MVKISYKGKLPIGEQEKIHLSTNNGLTGYKIIKFQIISSVPNQQDVAAVAKVYTKDQANSIDATVDLSQTDLIAVSVYEDKSSSLYPTHDTIIIDTETVNQDVYVTMADSDGNTTPISYYLELEQFSIDINTSTYHTLKNIRSLTEPGFTIL